MSFRFWAALLLVQLTVPAASLLEDFDTVLPAGWAQTNNSVNPGLGWTSSFRSVPIPGLSDNFIFVNFASTSVQAATGGDISNWLFSPVVNAQDGDVLTFWTASNGQFADRLEVRWSGNGASTDAGNTSSSTGDFTVLLTTINPLLAANGYPATWSLVTVNLSGVGAAPTAGRLAFRYFVTDGGEFGMNSNGIGIDLVSLDRAAATGVPEPALTAVAGLVLAFVVRHKVRKS